MANVMQFVRGDGVTHTFAMPTSGWTSGGTLFFAAKPAIDDDATDAAAVIKKSWNDGSVSDTVINGVPYKLYTCTFAPADTANIPSNGAQSASYLGEFQWVNAGGVPVTFPPTDPKIDVVVYFDVIVEI